MGDEHKTNETQVTDTTENAVEQVAEEVKESVTAELKDVVEDAIAETSEVVAEAQENIADAIGGVAEAADSVSEEPEAEPTEEERKAAKKKRFWIEFWDNVRFFAITFLVLYAVFYIFPPYMVSGDSMNNTLTDKAMGFGMRFVDPDHGDIIVFSNNMTRGNDYIKRVIGVPGDTVKLQGKQVYVNGELLTEDYAYFDPASPVPEGYYLEVTLDDDEYFVMGDNRCHSTDSRSIGVVHRDDIKCKMLFFLWGKH